GMRQPKVGIRGKIYVIAEQLLRSNVVIQLHQLADLAHFGAQWVELLARETRGRFQKGVRCGLQTKVRHRHCKPAAARSAARYFSYHEALILPITSTAQRRFP